MQNKLSIITINYNNAEGLRKTIESVVSQTYTDYEYIVIDGASIDGSVDVIKRYADKMSYWVSEPDKGIYNAMNKGIIKATGEYCLFLNSGDWLVDEKVIVDFCNADFRDDIISGNLFFTEDNNNNNNNNNIWKSPEKYDLEFSLFFEATLPHPGTFIKKELFHKYGIYNENNIIVSDWEFFLKCLVINNCSYNHFDRFISYYGLTGISSQPEMKKTIEKERDKVYQSHMSLFVKSYKKLNEEKSTLLTHEKEYREYMNLKNGKTSSFIKLLLWIKSNMKK